MKGKITTLVAAALLATLVGCASTEYIISTKDGKMITASGKPKWNEEAGMYVYKDAEGREATIRKEDVSQIMER